MSHADECEDDDDTRTAPLHALLQMDEARAAPILRRILARRDEAYKIAMICTVAFVSRVRPSISEVLTLIRWRNEAPRSLLRFSRTRS